MSSTRSDGVKVTGEVTPSFETVLTKDAVAFIAALHRKFSETRRQLLKQRERRQAEFDRGKRPNFLSETLDVRQDESWQVGRIPPDLQKRHVEITGPVERKMMINALNSGADVFMADFEDSNSPTWNNVVQGQINCRDAVNRTISFTNPDGKHYQLNDDTALLLIRPRGWHLDEKHLLVDGEPISASLFDFGLYFYHNCKTLLDRNSGPYFYLPKLENHLEARLWNNVFMAAQENLGVPHGTIKATVLIENILAVLEMDEILYELRDHIVGLNAGRWDYIFSVIKKFRNQPGFVLPDRSQITMTVPFMRAYTELLVKTCHKRGAHAIGGMAAFIPSRRNAEVNKVALANVREDKVRESRDGFDGTWVAHPDLVSVAAKAFGEVLGEQPHQKNRLREDVRVTADDLLSFEIKGGEITENGLRHNINVALQYLEAWLRGTGCVPIYNLMEDAATAEISRAQVWQWLHSGAELNDGRRITKELYRGLVPEELQKIQSLIGEDVFKKGKYELAQHLFDELVLDKNFADFLTLKAYTHLP